MTVYDKFSIMQVFSQLYAYYAVILFIWLSVFQQELPVNQESDLAYIQEISKDSFGIYNLGS